MKFVHIADMHFDSPFTSLSRIDNLSNIRRLEQRQVLKDIIEYIQKEKVPYLFIAGDLYEHEYVRQSTIEFINDMFALIPETKIFITPGNHDPYLKNSYYTKYKWSPNVYIFGPKIEKVELENICIYGVGFSDFYCKDSGVEKIEIENSDKINILIVHGNTEGGTEEDKEYNPLSLKSLREIGFDYVALGHIHKTNYMQNSSIIYPGSPISFGFDELGDHGMIVGEIENKQVKTLFVPLDKRQFMEIEMDVQDCLSEESLIEKINDIKVQENYLYKIILQGYRNFEIDTYQIEKMIMCKQILKIKDNTKKNYQLEELANEFSLKGLFIKNMLQKAEQEQISSEILEKAIEIGLNALEG